MRTIIAGSRHITDYEIVKKAIIDSGFEISTIFSGKARGVDTLGEQYAREFNIPLLEFPADWDKYGKVAGRIRNIQMSIGAEACIAIWDGKSTGTAHMIEVANGRKLKLFIVKVS